MHLKILEYTKENYQLGCLPKFCGQVCDLKTAFKIGTQMLSIMIEHKGMGLAANQVGLFIPLIIVTINEKPTILYNPTISFLGKDKSIQKEGCLSLPGIWLNIERPTEVHFSAVVSKSGKRKTFKLKELEARCFLHEYSHIQGKTILDEINP